MHRSALAALVVIPVAITAGCSAAHADRTDRAAHAAPTAPTRLTFVAVPQGGSGVDNPPRGPSVGDEYFEHGVLRKADHSPAGTFVLVTQLIAGNATSGQEQQSITLHLTDGDITAMAGITSQDSYTVPVLGGTGHYARARGVMTARPAAEDTETITLDMEN